jgi:hypothetical protein
LLSEISTLGLSKLSAAQQQTFHNLFDLLLRMKREWSREALVDVVENCIRNEHREVQLLG